MPLTSWLAGKKPCARFPDDERLFAGLFALDNGAIVCLQYRALPMVRKVVRQAGLDKGMTEEVLNESTLVFLRKIASGNYTYQGHALTTYLVEIARRTSLALNRRKNRVTDSLEDHYGLPAEDVAEAERREEAADQVARLLGRLDEKCAQVIRLKHIDGYADAEVIEKKLTAYNTVASLKMKRSGCMKKLVELAREWKKLKII